MYNQNKKSNEYALMCSTSMEELQDINLFSVKSQDFRSVYERTIQEKVSNVFKLGDTLKIPYAPNKWNVCVNEKKINITGNFLAIGTTRKIGDKKDKMFYQFKHPLGFAPDISRVHCVIYFYDEFCAVVDLWSNGGTQVLLDNKTQISSVLNNRRIIKISSSGTILLNSYATASNISINKLKQNIQNSKDSKDLEDPKDSKDLEDPKDSKDLEDPKDPKDSKDLEDPKDSKECVICLDNTQEYAIVPCGHKCVCETCSTMINNKCPICRENITSVIKIFNP